ncbi:MAG: cyclic-di-AMP receptor [Firmicutes bacterium]|nr:cyclic-di-AMP receptor [Bacillota bacterium]
MRLVIAVVDRRAAGAALERLRAAGYGVTRLASSGGFLRRGNTTLFAGVEDDQVDGVLEILRAAGAAAPGASVAFVTCVAEGRRL